mgnify:CR=1 FL=1
MCGEKRCAIVCSASEMGSPPRVRGKVPVEHFKITAQLGSPPRVRGKAVPNAAAAQVCGITPACAGKRSSMLKIKSSRRDHPRVCGEKDLMYAGYTDGTGSPPRVRGKAAILPGTRPRSGITPACAGKRVCRIDRSRETWDHPRVCGEKENAHPPILTTGGSPPRVRGKGFQGGRYRRPGRITPACAGKSYTAQQTRQKTQDHPRVCGEKVLILQVNPSNLGSPPRVRGKD